MDEPKQEKFRLGIEHFNCGEFFTCHEVLEEIWLTESPEEKPFYQGLIQAAAAFHHLAGGNRAGAASLLAAGLEKLENYPATKQGLALEELRAELRASLAELTKRGEESSAITPPKIRWTAAGPR